MNKSISDSIKRFRPTPTALPELIKGIVNIIENDLNESRVKRFTYDGDWKDKLIDILNGSIDDLALPTYTEILPLIKLIIFIADVDMNFVAFYVNFIFSISNDNNKYSKLFDYNYNNGNQTINVINLVYHYLKHGVKSAEGNEIYEKLCKLYHDSTTKVLQNHIHILMVSTTILEKLQYEHINYDNLTILLHKLYLLDTKNFMAYFKSYFVWKLSPSAGPQLSSELFRHYIAYNYRLYQEKENVSTSGAATKTNDVEKVLVNTLKETLATIEGGGDGKKPKGTIQVSSVFNSVLPRCLPTIVCVHVLAEGAGYICSLSANRIAALNTIASFLLASNDMATEEKMELYDAAIPPLLDAIMLDTDDEVRHTVLALLNDVIQCDIDLIDRSVYAVIVKKLKDKKKEIRLLAFSLLNDVFTANWPLHKLSCEEFIKTTKFLWSEISSEGVLPGKYPQSMSFLDEITRKCLSKCGYYELPALTAMEAESRPEDTTDDDLDQESSEWKEKLKVNEDAIRQLLDGLVLDDFKPDVVERIIKALQIT